MSLENMEIIRRLVDAWNRQDAEAILALIHPEGEYGCPETRRRRPISSIATSSGQAIQTAEAQSIGTRERWRVGSRSSSSNSQGSPTGQRRSVPDKFTTRINDVASSPVGRVLPTRPAVQQVDLALVAKADYLVVARSRVELVLAHAAA